MAQIAQPNLEDGIQYWSTQPATYDGVLGGFGTGSLPRIDSLGSRLFLLHLLPELSTVPSAFSSSSRPTTRRRTRALDIGAGVGRVTCDVLLHLIDDVVLLEPVKPFIDQAIERAKASCSDMGSSSRWSWKGLRDKTKSVTFIQGPLQTIDPGQPLLNTKLLERVGYHPAEDDLTSGFDIIWCQWCLGHLNDEDLAAFFQRCRASFRQPGRSVIIVKENTCPDDPGPAPCIVFDNSDSTLTRSDLAWKRVFQQAGLKLVKEQVQRGLPQGLYVVKLYALR